ncbi:hypothetical protein [uncultured Corynebacterium sp.]|uniref:hypothetical protein n=1 Tax=uncultured Corynebacterium sp. TaxID=159447 RepID=UPI00259644E7|nr:hypothetical protein [uncultured Corynebacterium sp.]
MAWMTKNLALDLLAILIGATENAYNTIKNAPDGNWPPAVEQPANEPAKQNTPPTPPQQQATEPTPNADALLVEAKNLLQGIVATGGREWVTGTLLPKFGVAKLSDVPADKLPQLVETAKQKQQEAGQ